MATEDDWNSAKSYVKSWLGFPFGQIRWGEVKSTFPVAFAKENDAALKDAVWLFAKHALDRMEAWARELRQD